MILRSVGTAWFSTEQRFSLAQVIYGKKLQHILCLWVKFNVTGIGHEENPDVDQLPDAVPRGNFNPVQEIPGSEHSIITFDLETTDLSMFL